MTLHPLPRYEPDLEAELERDARDLEAMLRASNVRAFPVAVEDPPAWLDDAPPMYECASEPNDIAPPPAALDLAEVLSRTIVPVRDVIPGFPDRGRTLVVSQPGGGKSLTLAVVAVERAAGLPVLGKFEGERLRVALFLEEDPPDETAARLQCITAALGLAAADLAGWLFVYPKGTADFSTAEGRERTYTILRRDKPDLVIFDTFAQIAAVEKIESGPAVRQFFKENIDPIIDEHLARAVWLSHHPNKGVYARQRQAEVNALIAGSIQFEGSVDSTAFILRNYADKDSRVILPSKYRQGRERGGFEVRITEDRFAAPVRSAGGRLPLTVRWKRAVDHEQAEAVVSRPTKATTIETHLRAHPGQRFTIDDLKKIAKCDRTTVQKAVDQFDDVKSEPDPKDTRRNLYFVEADPDV